MNILPKKRWHVRTRENIARVRKDEQEAAEEREDKKQRILKAEQEARTALLRQRARARYGDPDVSSKEEEEPSKAETDNVGHVNFFEELQEGKIVTTKCNAETEREEKEKREKYEKQIGYLTYLGQDTVESTGVIPWYDKVPDRLSINASQEETNMKTKLLHDPLTTIRKYIPVEKKIGEISRSMVKGNHEYHSVLEGKVKKKKHKKKSKKKRKRNSTCSDNSSESSDSEEERKCRRNLEQLRSERLKREKEERDRTEKLLARLQGKDIKEVKEEPVTPVLQQKYNSQYNPELAKQNFSPLSKNL